MLFPANRLRLRVDEAAGGLLQEAEGHGAAEQVGEDGGGVGGTDLGGGDGEGGGLDGAGADERAQQRVNVAVPLSGRFGGLRISVVKH